MYATFPSSAGTADFCYSCYDKQTGLTSICDTLSGSVPLSPHAHHLDLSHNNLTNDDLMRIAAALERNPQIEVLAQLRSIDLSFNDLRGDDQLRRVLSVFGKTLRGLQSLNLSHSGVGAAFFGYTVPYGVKLGTTDDHNYRPSIFGEMIVESSSDYGSDEDYGDDNDEESEEEESEDPFIARMSDFDVDADSADSLSDDERLSLAPQYSIF